MIDTKSQTTKHMEELATVLDQLTEPMKNVLIAGNAQDHQAGAGTWYKLKHLGLVDDEFNLTKLGCEVAYVIG